MVRWSVRWWGVVSRVSWLEELLHKRKQNEADDADPREKVDRLHPRSTFDWAINKKKKKKKRDRC